MCIGGGSPPPPPPLAPPPPPPPPPRAPIPEPEPVERDVNPTVKNPESKKDKNPYSQGTEDLKIPLKDPVNPGGTTQTGTNA